MELFFDEDYWKSELDYYSRLQSLIDISLDLEYCREMATENTPVTINKNSDYNFPKQNTD
jgi:hypothetical protein